MKLFVFDVQIEHAECHWDGGFWGPKAGAEDGARVQMLKRASASRPTRRSQCALHDASTWQAWRKYSAPLCERGSKCREMGPGRDFEQAAVPLGLWCLVLSGMDSFFDISVSVRAWEPARDPV